jgi:hypothetical protein
MLRHLHLLMQMIEKKWSIVRWTQFSLMALGSWLIDHVVVTPWVVSGCSKRSLVQMVLLISTRQGLWPRVIPKKEGKDLFDTYSPVARLTTICVLLSLAASHGLLVHQMDVKTTFLNGELEEEIYMTQSNGFVLKGQEDKVCKLLKFLYGLKQAPK